MALDKTKFDDWLKANLWRDLAFRSVSWITVAIVVSLYTAPRDEITANLYLQNHANNLFNIFNIFGMFSIFLGFIAMMFKDMEESHPEVWGHDTFLGKIGGVFRRLAGDLTLWTLGALVTILVIITVYGIFANFDTWKDWAAFSIFYLAILLICFLVALLNISIRRAGACLTQKIKQWTYILIIYLVVILCCLLYVFIFYL